MTAKTKARPKPTDIPEHMIQEYATWLNVDPVDVVDLIMFMAWEIEHAPTDED